MLDILGIPYVQSQGEAEAMCALLNAAGVCNGDGILLVEFLTLFSPPHDSGGVL